MLIIKKKKKEDDKIVLLWNDKFDTNEGLTSKGLLD